jgi:CxxC motif-containing protein
MSNCKVLTCIVCPIGCRVSVKTGDDGGIEEITGNSCKRGIAYAETECTNPLRTITSTVRVEGSQTRVVPVKTDKSVPKALILDCMKEINKLRISSPVRSGDIIIEDLLNTGANVIATGNAEQE